MPPAMLPRLRRPCPLLANLDGLPWADGVSAVALGVRIGVRVSDAEALPPLLPRLPPGWRPAPSPEVDRLYSVRLGEGPEGAHLLYAGHRRLAMAPDLAALGERLEGDLQLFVAEHATDRVCVHAGVVVLNGRALVLPGRSFSGKSTLVAALLQAGATYFSDEYAVLDAEAHVHPYARPLSLRLAGGTAGLRCRPEDLGGAAGEGPLPVAQVVLARYRPGAYWRPSPLSPARAVLALLRHAVPARRHTGRVLQVLQRLAESTPVVEGVRGEVEDVVPALLRDLAG